VPRARLTTSEGKTAEWKSQALRAYQRRTLAADALIASSYLAGTNTRRVRRALAALFGGTVGKDTVSRVWRKVKSDWDAWNTRSLAEEPIVRLILDGTVVRVRLDRKATSISLLVVLGVRADGQKVLLAIKSMGERAPRPGARSSTTSSSAGCGGPSSSLSTARRGSTRPSPPSGAACRSNAARS
jgi:putative transposase